MHKISMEMSEVLIYLETDEVADVTDLDRVWVGLLDVLI